MKNSWRWITLIFFWLVCCQLKGQDGMFPKSYVDLGIGAGPNYGMTGVKGVFGYKGSGLMVGVGSFDGQTAYQVGLQVKYLWFFLNVGYGTYGSYRLEGFGRVEKGLLNSMMLTFGGQINLYKQRFFLELGAGLYKGSEFKGLLGEPIVDPASLTGGIGIGYRIGRNSD